MVETLIGSDEWMCRFLDALGVESDRVARLVIDAVPGNILTVYVTYYGGLALLDVKPPSADEVKIICNQP